MGTSAGGARLDASDRAGLVQSEFAHRCRRSFSQGEFAAVAAGVAADVSRLISKSERINFRCYSFANSLPAS